MAVRKTTKKAETPVTKKRVASKERSTSRQSAKETSLMDYFRFGESYTSLILGIVVVIVAAILLVSLFKTRTSNSQLNDNQKGTTSISTVAQELNKITPVATVSVSSVPTTQVTPTVTKAPSPTQVISPTKMPTPTRVATPTQAPTSTPQKIQTNQAGQRTYIVKPGDDLWKIAENQYHDGYQWVAIAKANNLSNPGIINAGNRLVLPSITPTPTKAVAQQTQTVVSGQRITSTTYVIMHGDDLWDIAVRAYGDGYKWTEIAKANNLSSPNLIHSGNSLKIPR